MSAIAHKRHNETAREWAAIQSETGRDIAPLPKVVHPRRKKKAERDFHVFCKSYFPQTFKFRFSADHLRVIGQIETSVLRGGLFATAMPRGSGKTSLAETACIWATFYGHRSYVCLIGSDEKRAGRMLESIKTEIETNLRLLEDFPEAVYPITRLEGISLRAKGQLFNGERTHIGWTAGELVLPTIPDSEASGAVIQVAGITGGLRGMKAKQADGEALRPDLVVIDDPQTDESARSASQCETRERILAGAILGLAGPGEKISGIMPCTVIAKSDMADRILDRHEHPEWNGTRTKMLYSFPTNQKLWDEYRELRQQSLQAELGIAKATEFYRQHREAMDLGANVAWEERFEHDELSAIQHAMNLLYRNERAFYAEYQNEPLSDADARPDDLTPDQICAKINRHARGIVPLGCERITAFIDVQKSLLYYAVIAWDDGFSGNVLAYGAFPEQRSDYFLLRDVRNPIQKVIKAPDLEGQIYGALSALGANILGREWMRDDGVALKVERCLIDANWGDSTHIIYKFCRESQYAAIVTPSHGKFIGASGSPMREWAKREGERVGLNWRLRNMGGKRSVRSIIFDSNFWKSFIHNRLSVPIGSRSSLSLYGDRSEAHRMLADHLTSEYRVRVEAKDAGRAIDEWKIRPEHPENHLFDCVVGAAVAGSLQGLNVKDAAAPRPEKAKRVSFAEMQKERNSNNARL